MSATEARRICATASRREDRCEFDQRERRHRQIERAPKGSIAVGDHFAFRGEQFYAICRSDLGELFDAWQPGPPEALPLAEGPRMGVVDTSVSHAVAATGPQSRDAEIDAPREHGRSASLGLIVGGVRNEYLKSAVLGARGESLNEAAEPIP
jgi:hypothetical protein